VRLPTHQAGCADGDRYQKIPKVQRFLVAGAACITRTALSLFCFGCTRTSQVLPAYYSHNYVSLLPGEERAITISIAEDQHKSGLRLEQHGWNATPVSLAVALVN
jgi:Ig-like domain-containing protein